MTLRQRIGSGWRWFRAVPGWAQAIAVVAIVVAVSVVGTTGDNGRPDSLTVATPTASESTSRLSPTSEPTPSPAPSKPAKTPTPPAAEAAEPTTGTVTTVSRIVDGDTLYLADFDERLRLIGIDTPETKHPDTGVECFGHEASAHLADLVPPGTKVRVEWDVERYDRYDRPLGYLYRVTDGLFVNLAMVADGFAAAYTVPPNVAHDQDFVAAQREAREADRGLWSACRDDADEEAGSGAGGDPATDGSGDSTDPVTIATVRYDAPGADVEYGDSEYVELANGGADDVDVSGWSVTDEKDHRISLPSGYRIPAGATLRIYTGPGDDTSERYYAGESQAIWNNSGGDTATLRDSTGTVIDTYSYTS